MLLPLRPLTLPRGDPVTVVVDRHLVRVVILLHVDQAEIALGNVLVIVHAIEIVQEIRDPKEEEGEAQVDLVVVDIVRY